MLICGYRADISVQYALTKLHPGSRNIAFDFKLNVTKRSTILAGLHPVREHSTALKIIR